MNSSSVLRAYLLSHSAVSAAVTVGSEVRLYGSPGFPSGWFSAAPRLGIAFSRVASPGLSLDLPLTRIIFEFSYVHETQTLAHQLYVLIAGVLHNCGHHTVTVGTKTYRLQQAYEVEAPMDVPIPLTNYPRVLNRFSITFVTQEIT